MSGIRPKSCWLPVAGCRARPSGNREPATGNCFPFPVPTYRDSPAGNRQPATGNFREAS